MYILILFNHNKSENVRKYEKENFIIIDQFLFIHDFRK